MRTKRKKKPLSTRCNDVLGLAWKLQCKGTYPFDVKVKYGNRLVAPEDQYSIHYMPPDKYLVTMGKSKLQTAATVTMSRDGFLDENNKKIQNFEYLACVPFRLRFTEELAYACKGQFDGYAQFSVLNYAELDRGRKLYYCRTCTPYDELQNATYLSNANSLGRIQWWPLLLLGWFLLVTIFSSLKK